VNIQLLGWEVTVKFDSDGPIKIYFFGPVCVYIATVL